MVDVRKGPFMIKEFSCKVLLFLCCFKPSLVEMTRHYLISLTATFVLWTIASIALKNPASIPLALASCYLFFVCWVYRKARQIERGM